ncbi:MAG: hypothetical protein IJ731_09875 [Eubacterium sp.]|nr:hypothetical protein [Eubacterium sp.]
MVKFIANSIIKAKATSLENARQKYAAYFINTDIYAKYRADVNALLIESGNDDCILIGSETEVNENEG